MMMIVGYAPTSARVSPFDGRILEAASWQVMLFVCASRTWGINPGTLIAWQWRALRDCHLAEEWEC